MMEQPAQNPPVERMYMRLMVGRKGKPDQPAEEETSSQKPSSRKHTRRRRAAGADYLVELTTFHIRPRRPRGA
jgi:hypothetical protein